MNATIEAVKNYPVLPADVKVVEELHTFKLVAYQMANPHIMHGQNIACTGYANVACRYILVGDRKIPAWGKLRVEIISDFWRHREVNDDDGDRIDLVDLIGIVDYTEQRVWLNVEWAESSIYKRCMLVAEMPTTE